MAPICSWRIQLRHTGGEQQANHHPGIDCTHLTGAECLMVTAILVDDVSAQRDHGGISGASTVSFELVCRGRLMDTFSLSLLGAVRIDSSFT